MAGEVVLPVSSTVAVLRDVAGFRFPTEVIAAAVRWYLRYGLSYRDVEELLVERGLEVDHITVYRRLFADAARLARHRVVKGGSSMRRM